MPLPLMAAANIRWGKMFANILAFLFIFSVVLFYCAQSSFTSVWTSLLVSFMTACIMFVGIYLSKKFRCAVLVAIIMCFSTYGLAALFYFGSWIVISPTLGSFLANLENFEAMLHCLHSSDVESTNKTGNNIELEWHRLAIQSFGSVVHYGFFIPFLLVFVHSMFYTFTFKNAQNEQEQPRQQGSPNKDSILLRNFQFLFVFVMGAVLGSTSTLAYANRVLSLALTTLVSIKKDCVNVDVESFTFVFGYYIFACILLVVGNFSKQVNDIRDSIVISFHKKSPVTNTITVHVVERNSVGNNPDGVRDQDDVSVVSGFD